MSAVLNVVILVNYDDFIKLLIRKEMQLSKLYSKQGSKHLYKQSLKIS